MRLDLNDFSGGLDTYKDDGQLPTSSARVAEDCFVGDGALTPVPVLESGEPTGVDLSRFNDDEQCGHVEYDGQVYSGCDLSGLGLPQPAPPAVTQGDTPAVIGPSEDGSGSFNSAGVWEQTEFVQTNVWTFTGSAVVVNTNEFTGETTTTDSWVVCDTPPFNITEYYALEQANPSLIKTAPERDQYGCVIGTTGGSYSSGPGSAFVPKYFVENTSYAVSFYNEDEDIESTVSDITEFEHVPHIEHREWSYGPLQGDTAGKTWYPAGTNSGASGPSSVQSSDPSDLRGGRTQRVRYTGVSHLHQVKVKLPWHPNATHTVLYKRSGGSLVPIARTAPGSTVTIGPNGVFKDGTGPDLSLDSDLSAHRAVFTRYQPPPASLTGIAINAIGIMVGFKGNTIYISEPASGFHLWNPDAQFTLNYTPKSVHAIYGEFLITTSGKPVKLTGNDPSTMLPIELRDLEYNLDWRSAADAGTSVLWAGPNGVAAYDGGKVTPITRGRLSYADWKAIRQSNNLVGVASDEVYVLYHDNGSLVVDMRPESRALTTHSLTATKAVYGVEDGYIYLSGGRKWQLHEALVTEDSDTEATWKSGRIYIGNTNEGLAWMRVFAKGTVDVTIRNDKNHERTFLVSSSSPTRVGFGQGAVTGEWIEIEVQFHHRITGIHIASTIEELLR